MVTPRLIALDWGSSSLRAFLMGEGQVLAQRQSPAGLMHLPAAGTAGFEQAFAAVAADWLHRWPDLAVLACGMVGSAQGWREAPYLACPAEVRGLSAGMVSVATGLGPALMIVPGVMHAPAGGMPDMMRGEETQVAGALLHQPAWASRSVLLLPGTHAKWVQVEDGRIRSLATAMTGELFAVLKTHSLLGRLMTDEPATAAVQEAAFRRGLTHGHDSAPGALLHQLFSARSLGLSAQLPHAALADYLSGLLIGHELRWALGDLPPGIPLVVIGEPRLCQRYVEGLGLLGRAPQAVLDNTAPQGLWSLALAAGLVPSTIRPTP